MWPQSTFPPGASGAKYDQRLYSDAPGPDHAAVPLAVCPFLVFWGVRCGGLPGGGGPSALRWMAAGAEFPCDVPGGGRHRRCVGCGWVSFGDLS